MSQTPWARAKWLAAQTPETRNRYVDLLRAVSIGFVVLGHWLAAVAFIDNGELRLTHITNLATWSHWATWFFQVMPVFFMVGGYANAASWESTSSEGRAFGLWIAIRLRRLVRPIIPLLVLWCAAALIAYPLDINPRLFQESSRIALNPVWFLAVYLMVVLMVPVTYGLWRRYGIKSFWSLVVAALVIDIIGLAGGVALVRWLNYAFVWMAVFQLGYLLRERGAVNFGYGLRWAAFGLVVLLLLITIAGYPVSMITVPGAEVSNSRPPTVALLALAVAQFGLLRAVEGPVGAWLRKSRPWVATVFMNSMIMTVFLWHLTALAVVVSLSFVLGGYGMNSPPLSAGWWLSRPPWIMALVVALSSLLLFFARFERKAKGGPVRPLGIWQAIVGTIALCNGLALIALKGFGSEAPLHIQLLALLLVVIGGGLIFGQEFIAGIKGIRKHI